MIVVGLIFIVFLGILVFGLLLPLGNSVKASYGVVNPVTLSIAIFCVVLLFLVVASMNRED